MRRVKARNAKTKSKAKARPGNLNPVRSGLYAKSTTFVGLRDAQIRAYATRIRRQCPWMVNQDIFLIRRFCQAELLAEAIYARLRAEGVFTKDGEVKRLANEWRKLALAQLQLGSALGLHPQSRSALRNDSMPSAIEISDDDARAALQISAQPSDEK